MVNDEDDLDGEATETFSFKMSKALRARLGGIAGAKRITVGQEVLRRVLLSFAEATMGDEPVIPASDAAKAALAKANANEAKIAGLEARISKLERHLSKV